MVLGRILQATRGFSTSTIARAHFQQKGVPGATMPFGINNRRRLLALMIVFFGSGLGAPFFLIRYQLLKQ